MAWVATWELAAAVSEGGGLGILGAGNAPVDWVRGQIRNMKEHTTRPYGLNVPLFSPCVDEVIALCIEERVPVVTTGAGNPTPYIGPLKEAGAIVMPVVASGALAKRLVRVGADAVIAMAPYVVKIGDIGNLMAYFRAVAAAAQLPVFIQNHSVGTDMSVAVLERLVREIEYVDYIKEETMPVTHKITGLMEQKMPKLKGIFGGAGGRYMLLEYPRGVAGQMPGCHVTDVMVRYWDALEAGDLAEAKRIYGLLSPLYAIETQCHGAIYKEVLRRRGVIQSARSRNAAPGAMDEHDHRALDDILCDLEPLFTWPGGKPLQYGVHHPEPFDRVTDGTGNAAAATTRGELAPFDRQ